VVPWSSSSRALIAAIVLNATLAPAQDALRNSIAVQAAAQQRILTLESQPYTFKAGDFRLLLAPSLGLDWNDNVNLSKSNPEDDFILRPMLALNASYPITQRNLLHLNVTLGYDKYFQHDNLTRLRIQSGSEVSLDLFVKDIWFNFHDRFHYYQDAATEAAIANTSSYGSFENTIGLSATRDLRNLRISLGYDHQNYLSTSSQFDYRAYTSEMVFGRAGLLIVPNLTVGLEGTGAFTTYDQRVLNDNDAYSAGIYADWKPGAYFSIQPRLGYTFYEFQQTSLIIPAQNLDTWYFGVIATHNITEAVSYSLNAGHEVRLGIESDLIEDWYFRPNINFRIIKNLTFTTSLSYEHGKLAGARLGGLQAETYDWYGGGLSLAFSIVRNLTVSLNYRLTLRASDVATREYTQNLVGLLLTYTPK